METRKTPKMIRRLPSKKGGVSFSERKMIAKATVVAIVMY